MPQTWLLALLGGLMIGGADAAGAGADCGRQRFERARHGAG